MNNCYKSDQMNTIIFVIDSFDLLIVYGKSNFTYHKTIKKHFAQIRKGFIPSVIR